MNALILCIALAALPGGAPTAPVDLGCANSSYRQETAVREYEARRASSRVVTVPATASSPDLHGVTEIDITLTDCLGACPSYTLQYFATGEVLYTGHSCVPQLGTRKGRLAVSSFARLAELVHEMKFSDSPLGYISTATDQSGAYIRVVTGSSSKVLLDYGGAAPASVWALEQVLSSMAAAVSWTGPAVSIPHTP